MGGGRENIRPEPRSKRGDEKAQPLALRRVVEVFYEAYKRGYWSPSKELLDDLEKVRLEIEQLLE